MSIYESRTVSELLAGNSYPGRGIIVGMTPDGKNAVAAYFIMGRSTNSRNRIFVKKENAVFTEPFDPSKVVDPSLIIYAALRWQEGRLIVTNGDQTDTIAEWAKKGGSMEEALRTRCFEPDAPNYTPRISAVLHFEDGFCYEMSILKSVDEEGSECARYLFTYPGKAGLGHFIHTYVGDGNPLPSFQGEPERVAMEDDFGAWCDTLWNALDGDNKISLYVVSVNVKTGQSKDRLYNKNV
ncbi:MAG: IMP cyclohydrolase [Lachnospiraceae bacterium]|nr:IMP cyclohydrolase [Lachnospiraceae bacterium]